MAAEAGHSSFKDGRANLRDTAKWMTSGTFGIAALIVGSSTISRLGAMDPTSCRFIGAVGCLVFASALCWIPFYAAVRVLRSDVVSLKTFVDAAGGELKTAADTVNTLLGNTLPATGKLVSMREFARDFYAIRTAAWDASPNNRDAAEKAVAYIDDFRDICRDACITELVSVRFNRLLWAVGLIGPLILLLFLAATWAANPAKDHSALGEKPRLETLDASHIASLTAAQIPSACLRASCKRQGADSGHSSRG